MVYAALMVPLGLLAATDSLVRGKMSFGRDPRAFYLVPTSEIIVFGILVAFAFYYRRIPSTHKRLIYIANVTLLLAAVARWPITGIYRNNPAAALVTNVFLVGLAIYDYYSSGKVYRSTIYASLFLMFVQQARAPLARTELWMSIATYIQHAARGLV
jgi:hypothetical protein